jgi:hypothetical protein
VPKEILSPLGAVVLGLLWIFWRLDWNLQDLGARWDKLPILERLMAVVIAILWTALVEGAAWYSAP